MECIQSQPASPHWAEPKTEENGYHDVSGRVAHRSASRVNCTGVAGVQTILYLQRAEVGTGDVR